MFSLVCVVCDLCFLFVLLVLLLVRFLGGVDSSDASNDDAVVPNSGDTLHFFPCDGVCFL